jgi:3-isopropylmalate dehydrogenase
MKTYRIVLLPGDGIGVEVVAETRKVLDAVGSRHRIAFDFTECPVGGAAIDRCGVPLPDETLKQAAGADAVILGAVGGPAWDGIATDKRPEAGLLGLRKGLSLFANLRPVIIFDELIEESAVKEEVIRGVDIMVVRELTGDVYFGTPRGIEERDGQRVGINTLVYWESEIRRIAHTGFSIARRRRKKVTSVDKANVLESMALWRDVVTDVGREYPDVALDHMYVDNCAMQLIRNPREFDTILTTNMFGDIVSDEAAMLTGSLGMLPSASLGKPGSAGMFEPVHGSAPDIAGRGIANPIACILSAAMMLELTFDEPEAAETITAAVRGAIAAGLRTKDIYRGQGAQVSTREMGDHIAKTIMGMKGE